LDVERWGALCLLCVVGCVRAGFEEDTGSDGKVPYAADFAADNDHAGDQLGDQSGTEGVAPSPLTGTIVPLYVEPPHSAWTTLAQAAQAHPGVPVVAVANVSTGPGTASKKNFEQEIAALTQAGVIVIGYVKTNYGKREPSLVKQDIDRWSSFYSAHGLKGVILSQQADDVASLSYYKDLSSYAKGKGLSLVVGDPGTDPAKSYVGVMDTMVIYQNKGLPPISKLGGWHTQHPKQSFGILAHNQATLDKSFVASARQYVGYIYITNDKLPDPWDTLSKHFKDLLAELDK
jgi:hypothetical protein